MLTSDQRTLIKSNIPKSICGAFEAGNEIVLDYALRLSTASQRQKAFNIGIMSGLSLDYSEFDSGNY